MSYLLQRKKKGAPSGVEYYTGQIDGQKGLPVASSSINGAQLFVSEKTALQISEYIADIDPEGGVWQSERLPDPK